MLLLTQYFPPDITAAAFRLGAFREALERAGHKVVVLTTYPYKGVSSLHELKDNDVVRVKVGRPGTRIFDRLLEHLRFGWRAFAKYVDWYLSSREEAHFDFVVASSPPLLVAVVGLIIAVVAKATYIVDIRDIWPGSVTASGLLGKNSLPIVIARFVERCIYKRADFITCVSKGVADHVVSSVRCAEPKIRTVYNGVDEEAILYSRLSLRRRRVHSPISLVYAGNIGIAQNLGVVLQAIAQLDEDVRRCLRVRFIGSGPEREQLLERTARLGIAHCVSIEGPYDRIELVQLLATRADALLVHLRRSEVFERTIPSKLFEYLLYNLPIVYGLSGEAAALLESVGGNLRFEQDCADSLRGALKELVCKYDKLKVAAAGHREFVLRQYRRENTMAPLIDLLEGR